MSNDKKSGDLASLVKQSITGHPGYAEFAAWCQSQLIHPYQIYFLIWQASRDALVIELPESYATDADGYWMLPRKELRAAIEAAGLKVKP